MKFHLRLSRGARIFGACLLAALLVCSVVAVTPAVLQKVNAASCEIHQVGTPVSGSSSLANYTVYLMYNSCTGENFSLVRVVITQHTTPTHIQASVFRNSGKDGGATSDTEDCGDIEHGFCGSAPVYSPDNTAYACFTDWNANAYSKCTAAY